MQMAEREDYTEKREGRLYVDGREGGLYMFAIDLISPFLISLKT
jgi:hypothetical protein